MTVAGMLSREALTAWQAVANAGLTKQSLYELEKGAVGRAAYERALDSVNGANREILGLLEQAWGR